METTQNTTLTLSHVSQLSLFESHKYLGSFVSGRRFEPVSYLEQATWLANSVTHTRAMTHSLIDSRSHSNGETPVSKVAVPLVKSATSCRVDSAILSVLPQANPIHIKRQSPIQPAFHSGGILVSAYYHTLINKPAHNRSPALLSAFIPCRSNFFYHRNYGLLLQLRVLQSHRHVF